MSLESLLDATLDDLADLPEFKPFPAGAHRVTIILESKEVNKKPCVEMKMRAIETVDLAEPQSETNVPLVAGTESGVLFVLDNDIGQGKFKEIMKVLAAKFGTSKVRDTMESAKNAECLVITKLRTNKEDKSIVYTDVVKLEVL